jgi:predicted CXXCH cytochrome family protein
MANAYDDAGNKLPTDQFEKYSRSVHGRALLEKGDLGAPACNDCHGNHASQPIETLSVAQSCRTCHTGNGVLYDASAHKKVFEKHGWPECGACHGKHDIQETSDAMLGSGEGSVCAECHATYSKNNPACAQTANYFHDQLVGLSTHYERLLVESEKMARRGLDVEPVEAELETLSDGLRATRSVIHAFDRTRFDETALEPQNAAARIEDLVAQGDAELRWRRKGLFVALGLIAILLVLIRLKLAQLESRGD